MECTNIKRLLVITLQHQVSMLNLQLNKKGEAATATDIVKYGSVYRLKTKYGYVTASKEYVQKV